MTRFETLFPEIIAKKTISIVGLHKNVGKTTTLNLILQMSRNRLKIGLTSIGLDGEVEDQLFHHKKPRIFIEKGTIFATAHQCVAKCDITEEILEVTDISSSLGKIVLIRAKSDGYIFLAGPSHTSEIKSVIKLMQQYNCDLILVDGAFSRRTLASPRITNATILAVGAAFSDSMVETISTTKFITQLLTLPKISSVEIESLCSKIDKVGYISFSMENESKQVATTFDGLSYLVESLSLSPKYLVIKGVITDTILQKIMRSNPSKNIPSIITTDATKILISEENYHLFSQMGGNFFVLHPLHLLCITINPWSPSGYHYSEQKFLKTMQKAVDVPVFNLLGET